jgi:hypothetical protein
LPERAILSRNHRLFPALRDYRPCYGKSDVALPVELNRLYPETALI